MPSVHPIHLQDLVYAPPDVHVPREAYGNDDDLDVDYNSFMGDTKGDAKPEDWLLPDDVFERLVLENNGMRPTPQRPHDELVSVLLPIPRSSVEEKELFEHVMTSLRKRVAELEEEELFESAMRSFTHRSTTSTEPTSSIINVISESTLGIGESNAAGLGEQPRATDVKELLRAEIREARIQERIRKHRDDKS